MAAAEERGGIKACRGFVAIPKPDPGYRRLGDRASSGRRPTGRRVGGERGKAACFVVDGDFDSATTPGHRPWRSSSEAVVYTNTMGFPIGCMRRSCRRRRRASFSIRTSRMLTHFRALLERQLRGRRMARATFSAFGRTKSASEASAGEPVRRVARTATLRLA